MLVYAGPYPKNFQVTQENQNTEKEQLEVVELPVPILSGQVRGLLPFSQDMPFNRFISLLRQQPKINLSKRALEKPKLEDKKVSEEQLVFQSEPGLEEEKLATSKLEQKAEFLLDEYKSVFYDGFSKDSLDADTWLIAYSNWGGGEINNSYNGGVSPENVSIYKGKLILKGLGNNYQGVIKGINKDKSERSDGKRVGAAIATQQYFASGRYEIRMKVAPQLGVCSGIWMSHYQEYSPGDPMYQWKPVGANQWYAINSEIDIEFPGRDNFQDRENISFSKMVCNTWVGENEDEYVNNFINLDVVQNDGEFHLYRFDWHTGGKGERKRVEFYVDNKLVHTQYEKVPTCASRLWVGVWFPQAWAGVPDFAQTQLEVDYVKVTPFHQPGDDWYPETFAQRNWSDWNPKPKRTVFFEDFSHGLSFGKWKVAKCNWGKQLSKDVSFSGGVVPENIYLEAGMCYLQAHGNYYQGPVLGVNKLVDGKKMPRSDGKRVGAAIATKDYFASGKYEVCMKVAPEFGVFSGFWTSHRENFFPQDKEYLWKEKGQDKYYQSYHHIQVGFPGRKSVSDRDGISFSRIGFVNGVGENEDEKVLNFFDLEYPFNDGKFHVYRFDWYTGDKVKGEAAHIDYYVDGELKHSEYAHVPTKASRFWIGAWFPYSWAGSSNFDVTDAVVDWVRITPFNQPEDTYALEEEAEIAWAPLEQYPSEDFRSKLIDCR